jgi:predicted alpha-1,6-mannanase (GH76 family)
MTLRSSWKRFYDAQTIMYANYRKGSMMNRLIGRCITVLAAGAAAIATLTATTGVAEAATFHDRSAARAGVDALSGFYNTDTGLWDTTGWWNSANALTATIDYALATGDRSHDKIIENTYKLNLDAQNGQFTNDYLDDTGWWALAWIRAYDLTGKKKYLQTAAHDVDFMWSYRTDTCGGGVLWNRTKTYKNAVTNELLIKAAASLHNRIHGDQKYLSMATTNWDWFVDSGMINSDNMINDGLTDDCANNGQTTWTYNQGIILGAAVELADATGDDSYLRTASQLADASTTNSAIIVDGVLTEPCEADGGDCGGDGPSFKGAYIRGLGELNAALHGRPYQDFLLKQAETAYQHDRTASNLYGVHWAGPIGAITAATQHSAVEALIAPLWQQRIGHHRH